MELKVEKLKFFITVISVSGRVDGSNYRELIDLAEEQFAEGTEKMVLELGACEFMSSAGMVALHSIALLARGEKPADTDQGWRAIGAVSMDKDSGIQENFVLANLQPQIHATLEKTGLLEYFKFFDDRQQAVEFFME